MKDANLFSEFLRENAGLTLKVEMAQVKHLTNAPIKEALIDFRVSVPEVRPEDIVTIEKEIKDIFERKEGGLVQ